MQRKWKEKNRKIKKEIEKWNLLKKINLIYLMYMLKCLLPYSWHSQYARAQAQDDPKVMFGKTAGKKKKHIGRQVMWLKWLVVFVFSIFFLLYFSHWYNSNKCGLTSSFNEQTSDTLCNFLALFLVLRSNIDQSNNRNENKKQINNQYGLGWREGEACILFLFVSKWTY